MSFALWDGMESLTYWRARRARLPWWRVGARREATRMAAAWERRLRLAVLQEPEVALGTRAKAGLLVVRSITRRWARRMLIGAGAFALVLAVLAGASLGLLLALLGSL
jgi:hypothetical protein